jgi:uncharacterized membrane protein
MTSKRILVAGESSIKTVIHQKGADIFTTTSYGEAVGWLKDALTAGGWEVDFLPNHVAATKFPGTAEELSAYDCVILSDIGANTLLLHPETFSASKITPNRLAAIRDYVKAGGGLIMVGGYMSFQGIDGKARYAGTAIEEALPVTMRTVDDRVETPEGVIPSVTAKGHPVVQGLEQTWPALLGYNEVTPKPDVDTLVTVGNHPLIVVHEFEKGRAAAFTSDCGPHWAPPAFVDWKGYAPLWQQLAGWVAGSEA